LWVSEEVRGQGYGQALLEAAEEAARKRGCKNVNLDTMSFQAPAFYQKLGYRIFGQLDDFPTGYTRYYLTKQL
jgi:ribosomal protein S18 acetylase RimI-like enzyme